MSGSSLDGLDIAYCRFTHDKQSAWHFEILEAETIAFDARWHSRLSKVATQPAEALARTDIFFGHWLGEKTAEFIKRHNIAPQFVASHGQTIFHRPEKSFTYQIGDGESLAAYLDCPVVTNFRNKDLALGGHGAPLVPFGEKHLFSEYTYCLNLGGISNLSYRDTAFDVSPCNMVLNKLAQSLDPQISYDPEGRIAASGALQPALFEALNAIPWYRTKPPRSLGAEWLTEHFFPVLDQFDFSVEDKLHTCTEHIAFQIGEVLRKLHVVPGKMLVTGGGFFNRFLRQRIQANCKPYDVSLEHEISHQLVQFKEALIFAFLGLMVLHGKPNINGMATGSKQAVLGGAIHLPAKGFRSFF
jgi:anhydro-N-acetylmuramic acid kinase